MSFSQVGWSPFMTNTSKVFALKYRPQIFEDLIGHEEISSTIYNSIKVNKAPNAYLFTGIRGIGKTTFARIVAKALNCEKGVESLCNDNFCTNCEAIAKSNHIDVLEIDAASKTGVDDVRELIEFSRYAPSVAKYKIFIIDEVHMLSKQAFNALLKTLEEPPKYLKFIFATTEFKKIPITVISRCQRYDLARVQSEKLFNYIKNIGKKEEKEIEDNAIKLIVKISEGSVRDALSLLDRALISDYEDVLTFEKVQQIFGYVSKSSYIDLLEHILKGDEIEVLKHYKIIYNSGVQYSNFLNEFLEILYYLKNISHIENQGTNFLLNDSDYKKIISLSKNLSSSSILLFWDFTIKTIKEINIVSNPNLSIEMFLIQLMYLNNRKPNLNKQIYKKENNFSEIDETENIEKKDLISQIKNIQQEEVKVEKKDENKIRNLKDLIHICLIKKEMQLKYDLENNVNLVSFSSNRIEISFNEKLNKNFVKELSEKLFEWTNQRWIISFSKNKGSVSEKEKNKSLKDIEIKKFKKSDEYNELLSLIPDLELVDIKKK